MDTYLNCQGSFVPWMKSFGTYIDITIHASDYTNFGSNNKWNEVDFSWFHSFIHSDHFYSASLSPLLLRSAPDTARILCRSFTSKRHRQLQVKDLPKVPTYRLERESNPRPSGWKLSTQPLCHHVPVLTVLIIWHVIQEWFAKQQRYFIRMWCT